MVNQSNQCLDALPDSKDCKSAMDLTSLSNQSLYLIGMLCYIISASQIYEWLSMRLIILWQRFKHTEEALSDMQDKEKKKLFEWEEKKLQYAYFTVVSILTIRDFALLFNIIDSASLLNNIYGFLMPTLLLVGLIYSYNSLTDLLDQFHFEHY